MRYRFLKTVSVERKAYKADAIVDASELPAGCVESMIRMKQIEEFVEGGEVAPPGNFATEDADEGGKPEEAPRPKSKPKPSKKAKGKSSAKPVEPEETEPSSEDAEPSSPADPVESTEPEPEPGEPDPE